MLLTFKDAEDMLNILTWRENPQAGLEARRTEMVRAGWDTRAAETAIRWLLAYRMAWLAAMAGRESTAGVKVTLDDVKRYMAVYQEA